MVLVFVNAVLNNFHGIIGFKKANSVPEHNSGIKFILSEERKHFGTPLHHDVGQFYRFHFHKNHPFLFLLGILHNESSSA